MTLAPKSASCSSPPACTLMGSGRLPKWRSSVCMPASWSRTATPAMRAPRCNPAAACHCGQWLQAITAFRALNLTQGLRSSCVLICQQTGGSCACIRLTSVSSHNSRLGHHPQSRLAGICTGLLQARLLVHRAHMAFIREQAGTDAGCTWARKRAGFLSPEQQALTRPARVAQDAHSAGLPQARLLVDRAHMGIIMGKGGATVAELRRVSGANIKILNTPDEADCERVHIFGSPQAVRSALEAVSCKLSQAQSRAGVGARFLRVWAPVLGAPSPVAHPSSLDVTMTTQPGGMHAAHRHKVPACFLRACLHPASHSC